VSDRQSRTYTGIGARRTPSDVLDLMHSLAMRLSGGWVLRSGGADGADRAFEEGAAIVDLDRIESYRTDCGWSGHLDLTPDGPIPEAMSLRLACILPGGGARITRRPSMHATATRSSAPISPSLRRSSSR
jgi:hypothetical protein